MRPKPKFDRNKGKAGICRATGKVKYTAEKYAKAGITFIWGSDPNADVSDLHVYRCPHCRHFHIGHRSAYERKVTREAEMPNMFVQTLPG